jgi:hypothetical protein
VCGLAFVAWTFPFDLLWWSYLYDMAEPVFGRLPAQVLGAGLTIGAAFLCWFVLFPRFLRWANAKTSARAA